MRVSNSLIPVRDGHFDQYPWSQKNKNNPLACPSVYAETNGRLSCLLCHLRHGISNVELSIDAAKKKKIVFFFFSESNKIIQIQGR